MNRKIDRKLRDCTVTVCSSWTEEVKSTSPGRNGSLRVGLILQNCSDVSKKVLSPDKITMAEFIRTGVPIDPKDFLTAFNVTDPIDLQQLQEQKAGKLYDYVKAHERELLDELGKVQKDVEPNT